MSLPTSKPAQLSIRSFFQAKGPKYAPPPSQSTSISAPPPPTQPQQEAAAEPQQQDQDQDQDQDDATPPPPPPPAAAPVDLPPEATIRPVTPHDINALRRINALLLPVSYSDSFYTRAASSPFARVITWAHANETPKVVGGVVCALEPPPSSDPDGNVERTLYIQSLCLLSPYRGLGLVGAAVEAVVAAARQEPALRVRAVTAHVWTENTDGLRWYDRQGFRRVGAAPIRGYYLKLRPDSAWLMSRDIAVSGPRAAVPASAAPAPKPSATAAVVNLPPPRSRPPPSRTGSGQSYQNQRPETEWNDLPEDMSPGLLAPPRAKSSSEPGSGASSRSSSTVRKKRDRSYPAAAFGAP